MGKSLRNGQIKEVPIDVSRFFFFLHRIYKHTNQFVKKADHISFHKDYKIISFRVNRGKKFPSFHFT